MMTSFSLEWLARLQDLATLAIPLFLLWHHRLFAVPLVRFATNYPGLSLVLAIIYGMVYGLVGSGFGIPSLFWHDDFLARSFSSAGAAMLLAVIGLIAYYLDPYPGATGRKTAEFLRADEAIRHRIRGLYARSAATGDANESGASARWGWPNYTSFAANVLIDPFIITPLQVWLEPRRDNSLLLQRFLRAARNPFLILLIMPALLPGAWCFAQIPKAAPTGHLGTPLESLFGWAEPPVLDVSRDLKGYLIGLASWLLGIWAGVLIVKVLIRLSTIFHGVRPLHVADRVPAGSGTGAGAGSIFRRVAAAFGGGPLEPSGARSAPRPGCPLAESDACPAADCPQGEPTAPAPVAPGCLARSEFRASAVVFVVLFFLAYAALGYVTHLHDIGWLGTPLFVIPPAFAICTLLAVFAMANAIVAYLPRPWPIPLVALLVAWLGLANSDPFKNRFERISYADRIPLRERVRKAYDVDEQETKKHPQGGSTVTPPSRDLIADGDAFTSWIDRAGALGGKDLDSSKRPKLVIVAVSGGATRSAYWTAVVLKRLEEELGLEFGQRVRILCGASGGMLGAACYAHYRRKVAEWFDLRLMSWGDGSGVPTQARNLFVVGNDINGLLHIRFFNAAGKLITDTDETRIPAQAASIGSLKEQLRALPPSHELTYAEKAQLIKKAALIVDQTLPKEETPSDWIDEYLPTKSMDPLARGIALSEIWKAFWPGFVERDRGVILESDWTAIRYPIADLADRERKGEIPSLIFSPMIVEDGRRLLISNLQLGVSRRDSGVCIADSPLIESKGQQIRPDVPDPGKRSTATPRFSLSGLEYFRLFNGPTDRDLLLSTAVRMSASFPYVSPAVNLPCDPPRRVVDAGYFDNYGIQVAAAWIRKNRDWLAQNTSGVLMVQIRDASSVLDRLEISDSPEESLTRGFQFFTSPPDAVFKARYTTGLFRNDADVADLDSTHWDYGRKSDGTDDSPVEGKRAPFFATVIFENSAEVTLDPVDFWQELRRLNRPETGTSTPVTFREVAMSWYLTRAEMAATRKAIPRTPDGSEWTDVARRDVMNKLHGDVHADVCSDRAVRLKRLDQLHNYERLQNLKKWWQQDPRRP